METEKTAEREEEYEDGDLQYREEQSYVATEYGNSYSAYGNNFDMSGETETETAIPDDMAGLVDTVGGDDITSLMIAAATVISGLAAFIANIRKKMKSRAIFYINQAEQEFAGQKKAGKSKRLYAIQGLSKSVPALVRPFLGNNFAEKIIDTSFGDINRFAKMHQPAVFENKEILSASAQEPPPDSGGRSAPRFVCKSADSESIVCQNCAFYENSG